MKAFLSVALIISILAYCIPFIGCDDDDDDTDANDDIDDDLDDDDDDVNVDADDEENTSSDFSCSGRICTDLSSGLMWQNDDEINLRWRNAKNYCEELDWGEFSDWRLPTISEQRSLIRGCPNTESGGACRVSDNCLERDCRNVQCNGCLPDFGPGREGQYWPEELLTGRGWWYWSSSEDTDRSYAWGIIFDSGYVINSHKYYQFRARCARNLVLNDDDE